jgi:hypothetical protein
MTHLHRFVRGLALPVILTTWSFGAAYAASAVENLKSTSDWSNTARVARLCLVAGANALTDDLKPRCLKALTDSVRQRIAAGNPSVARDELTVATRLGLPDAQAKLLDDQLKKAEKKAAKNKEKVDAVVGEATRLAYGQALRQKYLDDNLDIEVKVSGPKKTRITLKFALFNAVWANKVQKGDLITEMKNMGFTRLDMTDGYDYGVYWDLK